MELLILLAVAGWAIWVGGTLYRRRRERRRATAPPADTPPRRLASERAPPRPQPPAPPPASAPAAAGTRPPPTQVSPAERARRLAAARERVDTRLAHLAQQEVDIRRSQTPATFTQSPAPAAGAPSDAVEGGAKLRGIVFLDVETTGLDRYARVVTLGMLWLGMDGSVNTLHLVFDPRRDSHPEAAAIHGWDDWTLRHQDLFADHADRVHTILASAHLIVAHNAAFDRRLLERELEKAGLSWPDVDVACTMEMARSRWPGQKAGLDVCLSRIGVPARGARHGALEDAMLAMALFYFLRERDVLRITLNLGSPSNLREAPPRPSGELPRRSPKRPLKAPPR